MSYIEHWLAVDNISPQAADSPTPPLTFYFLLTRTMLDLKQIRENPEEVQKRLDSRGGSYDIAPIIQYMANEKKKKTIHRRSVNTKPE